MRNYRIAINAELTKEFKGFQIKDIIVDPGTMAATLTSFDGLSKITVSSNYMHRNNPRAYGFYLEDELGYQRYCNYYSTVGRIEDITNETTVSPYSAIQCPPEDI